MKNKAITDFIHITFIQGLNYLVPLLLTPYIVRLLGPESFGVVSFSQSFAQYFTLLVNFGFDLSAVREMATLSDRKQRSKLFSDVFCSKFLLFLISFLIFILLNLSVDKFREYFLLNLLSFSINIGYLLYPAWFFQAMGKMRTAVIINGIFKILMAAFVLLFIRSGSDFVYYNLFVSGAQVLLGLTSFIYVLRRYNFKIELSRHGIVKQIQGSAIIFMSSIMINLYTNTNTFLLGILSNHEATGYFASSSKLIYGAIFIIFVPFSLILYPKISAAIKEDEKRGIEMLKRAIWIALFIGLAMSLTLFVGAKTIIGIVYGDKYMKSVADFRILSALPLLLALSNIFVTQGMINLRMDKLFLKLTIGGAAFCLLFNYLFVPYYHDIAACYALVLTELLITIIGYIILYYRIGGNIFEAFYLKRLLFSVVKKASVVKPSNQL